MSPGVKNLFGLLEIFAPTGVHKQLMDEYEKGTLKYVNLKSALADAIVKHLKPIQAKRRELEHDKNKIGEILIEGERKAQKITAKNMEEIREKIGIR